MKANGTGLGPNANSNPAFYLHAMGGNQSVPKVTAQDKAILEYGPLAVIVQFSVLTTQLAASNYSGIS